MHVQTYHEVHPASCTLGTGSYSGGKGPGRDESHPPISCVDVTAVSPVGLFQHTFGPALRLHDYNVSAVKPLTCV